MSHWRSKAGTGLAAALLASLLATSLAATTVAYSVTNANPSVTVPAGVPTYVGISYVWTGTSASDTIAPLGTAFAVTLPSGYSWIVLPAFTALPTGSITFSGPVASNGGLTETWTLATFNPGGGWTLALTGGTVVTTGTAGSGPITLKVGTATPVQIASLTSSQAAGTAVPFTISPTAVPADGVSTIQLKFGAPIVTCTNTASFTVATTGGTFTTTTLPGVTSPVNGTSVSVSCASFASVNNSTLTLRAPTTPGTATITVTLAGSITPDSSTTVTFTPVTTTPGSTAGEKGHGARKVAFYASASTSACAAAPVLPAAGARSYGFAIANTTGNQRLIVEVSLKGALPNATYSVAVQQAPGTCSAPFTIRTNGRGNGNGHAHLTLVAGAGQVWVTATSGSSVLVTPAATLTVKGHDARDSGDRGKGNKDNGHGHGHGHEND